MSDNDCYEQVMATLRDMEALSTSMKLENLSRKVSSACRVADREFGQNTTGRSTHIAFSPIASSTAQQTAVRPKRAIFPYSPLPCVT